jgi:hypothetical protein
MRPVGEDNCCAVNKPNAAIPTTTKAAITATRGHIALSTPTTASLDARFPYRTRAPTTEGFRIAARLVTQRQGRARGEKVPRLLRSIADGCARSVDLRPRSGEALVVLEDGGPGRTWLPLPRLGRRQRDLDQSLCHRHAAEWAAPFSASAAGAAFSSPHGGRSCALIQASYVSGPETRTASLPRVSCARSQNTSSTRKSAAS